MQPIKLELEECGTQSIERYLDKATQTSRATIIGFKASVQTPNSSIQHSESSDKGSVTLFEFCQILQNPDCPKSVTIIKDNLSQEVQNHSKNPSIERVASRLNYCREVIRPVVKANVPLSKEKLIKDVLASARQDFPNYQSCTENSESVSIEYSRESSKVDAVTSFDSKPSKVIMDKEENDKKAPVTKIKQRPGCFPTDVDTPSGIPDPGCNIKPRKSVEIVESTEKGRKPVCPPKKPIPKVCDPTCESECARHAQKKKPKKELDPGCPPPIDYCTRSKAKPTLSAESVPNKGKQSAEAPKPVPAQTKPSATMKKPKPAPAKVAKKEISKTDSQTSSVSAIRSAMENFITKVCTSTTESFSMIRKGGVQDSGNTDSPCDDEEDEAKDGSGSKGFSFFRKVDSLSKDNTCNDNEDTPDVSIDDFDDNIDSAMSNISETIDFSDLPDPKVQNLNESRSFYEDRNQPKDIANIIVQTNITSHGTSVPESCSVFNTIKTKICSLFSDDKNKDGSNSSMICSQLGEDEDADLMERLIE